MVDHVNIIALVAGRSYDYGRTFLIILVLVVWSASLLALGIVWPRTGWSLRRLNIICALSVPLGFWLAFGYLGGVGWPFIVVLTVFTILLHRVYSVGIRKAAEAYKKRKAEKDKKGG